VRTHGLQAILLILAVIGVWLQLQGLEVAKEQLEVDREALRLDERLERRPATTGAITDADIDRIVKALQELTDRPHPESRKHDAPKGEGHGHR
jgi:hypothetical protein